MASSHLQCRMPRKRSLSPTLGQAVVSRHLSTNVRSNHRLTLPWLTMPLHNSILPHSRRGRRWHKRLVPRRCGQQAVVERSKQCAFHSLRAHVQRLNLNDFLDAMQQFAQAQSKWYPTWPQSEEDRAMRMYAPLSASQFARATL